MRQVASLPVIECPHDDRIDNIEKSVVELHGKVDQSLVNQEMLISLATAYNGVSGFVRKHGSKALSFGCGIMSVAGIGNPAVWKFIQHFFGQ